MRNYDLQVERVRTAIERHLELINNDAVSVPSASGYLAVLCSTQSTEGPYPSPGSSGHTQIATFMEEADAIIKRHNEKGLKAEKVVTDSIADVMDVVRDEQCSDIIAIGNGSYNSLWLSDQHLTWWNLSKMACHLKAGVFVQRTCGHYETHKLNVSLPTFIMRDQRNIFAPYGHMLDDANPDESLIKQVYQQPIAGMVDLVGIDHGSRKPAT